MNDTECRKNGKIYHNMKLEGGNALAEFKAMAAFNEKIMGDVSQLRPLMKKLGKNMIMKPLYLPVHEQCGNRG